MRTYRYILFIIFLTILSGCLKEQPGAGVIQPDKTYPFSVSVDTGLLTRASFNGSEISSGNYIFADGDKLYVTGGDGNLSGILTLLSGVGTSSADFGGDITASGGFTPTTDTDLTFTLVGSAQTEFFTITDGKVTGVNYPTVIPYNASISELVQTYSHFTTTVKYGTHKFTLNQQTVFLNFSIERLASDFTGTPSSVQVDIKSSDGENTLRSVTGVPVDGSPGIANMVFTTVFPAGTGLQGAQIIINNGSGIHCTPDFAADLTLLANKYYGVDRSSVEPFTIEAPSTGDGTNITFKYTPVQYRKYSGGTWTEWADYSSTIILSAGEKLSFRGQLTSCNNSGSKPLFTTTNPVYVYGDIMSLMCDSEWGRKYAVGDNAFYQAFKGLAVDIPADKDLILSADVLGASCYKNMFYGCPQLTKSPVILATNSAVSCYESMFQGCSALVTPPSALPITTVAAYSFMKMFFNCSSLESAPELSFTTVGDLGCSEMFSGCSAMITPPSSLPGETLGFKAYYRMFYNCSSLTEIPDFPCDPNKTYVLTAATNADNGKEDGLCFQMFFQCNALQSLEGKKLFNSSTELKMGCFQDMFSTCGNLTTVPNDLLPATQLAASCYRGMFQKTKITHAPDLLAETLQPECYRFMFNNCTNLVYIKCYSTTAITSDAYTRNWVQGAKNTTTCEFHYRSGVTWNRNNTYGIPTNWQTFAE